MRNIFKLQFFIMVMMLLPVTGNSYAQDEENTMLRDMTIPLMDGLHENEEEAILFDSPDGRIISAQAQGSVGDKEAFDYYRMVLPSLGWQIVQDNQSGLPCDDQSHYCLSAFRDQENLTVNVSSEGNMSVVNYSLSPR